MGNAGSQTGQLSQGVIPEGQWGHSFPRTQPTKLSNQHKVLPERNVQLKLRSTNNGEILHSGGTLSGRPSNRLGDKYHEYPAPGFKEHIPSTRKYFPKERDPQHKSRAQGVQHKLGQNASSQMRGLHGQMKMYVSEPDLRYPSNQEFKEKRTKKKYKAPPPPQTVSPVMDERSSLDWTNNNGKSDLPIRKARLFKTRAETKKQSSHVQELSSLECSENIDPAGKAGNRSSNRLSLQETKQVDTEIFYKELKEATKRLRHIELDTKTSIKYDPSNTTNREKLKTLDHNAMNAPLKEKLMEKIAETKNNIPNCARGEASGKESTTPEMSPNFNTKVFTRDKPRTFYFGMNDESNDNVYTNEMFDNYTANLHQKTKIPHSSESDISSYIDSDENDVSKSGIDLQLRPILPKKQLEIPRFSPAAAWRLLSMDTNENTAATTASDDVPVFVEERIEKYARPPPPFVHAGQRSSNDKSGDSGISGDDAIPIACYEDNNDSGINQENHVPAGLKMLSYLNNHERISWTPQQDLGDDSSIEEFIIDEKTLPKIHTGPHLFSLSLPRDNHLASYMIEKSNSQYSGLQKLKKSLSGVLNNLSNRKDYVEAQLTDDKSSNWFFSKSAPNSLNNAFHSLEMRKSQECELIYPQTNKTTRLMYLPEMRDINLNKFKKDMNYDIKQQKTPSLTHSKSYEDIPIEVRREPEPLQDPQTKDDLSWRHGSRKPKKFTFQSTIRQIEKKRLSDKLSREAERREQKRIQELEAMQKVEEEFQKKRAREKANIRQQLKLYCLDEDPAWSSLPPNLEMKDEIRPEPDGAFSSSTSSSSLSHTKSPDSSRSIQKFKDPELKSQNKVRASTTRELSEFRQVQRDYKEYRGSSKYANDGGHYRQTTVHPQVTCNMPKVKGMKPRESSNYRKDFASGIKSTQSAGSTYSEDSQNLPRMYNKHTPMPMSYLDQDLIHC